MDCSFRVLQSQLITGRTSMTRSLVLFALAERQSRLVFSTILFMNLNECDSDCILKVGQVAWDYNRSLYSGKIDVTSKEYAKATSEVFLNITLPVT